MSWLGERYSSFTEKLSALTIDVLNENGDNAPTDETEKQNGVLSSEELMHLCKEKDMQIGLLKEEKESLERSIEELDQQHQEVIDELLSLKNDAVKENSELKAKLAEKVPVEKTGYQNFDYSLCYKDMENELSIKLISDNDISLKKLNLIFMLQKVCKSDNEDRFSEQIKWLESQKHILENKLNNENECFLNNLSDKIKNYINFLQAVSVNSRSLSPVIEEIGSVIDCLISDNVAMKENINSATIDSYRNSNLTENNKFREKSLQVELKYETCDSCLQINIPDHIETKNISLQTYNSTCQSSAQTDSDFKFLSNSMISNECQTDSPDNVGSVEVQNNIMTELRMQIEILEQEKADLEEELSHQIPVPKRTVTSVSVQANDDYVCRCKYMESEISSQQKLFAAKEDVNSCRLKELTDEVHNLKSVLKSKDSMIKDMENVIHTLKLESKTEKNKSKTLAHELSNLKFKNEFKNITDKENALQLLPKTCNCNASNEESNGNNRFNANDIILLHEKLKQLDLEKSKLLCVLNEKSQECSTLKAEVHKLTNIVASEKQALFKLQQDNCDLKQSKSDTDPELTKETVQKLSRLVRDKDFEIDSLKQKNSTLTTLIQDVSAVPEHLQSLLEEKENLAKQINVFKSERDKIMASYNSLDKECRLYASEVKKLKSILSQQKEKFDVLEQEHSSVAQQYEEKQKSLINTQNELIALKQRVTDLEQQQVDIKGKYSELLNKINSDSVIQITKNELNEKNDRIEQLTHSNDEKDHLIQEKDCMIHDLSQQIKKLKSEYDNHEQIVAGLQKKMSEMNDKLKEYESTVERLNVEKETCDLRLKDQGSETMLLKEMNERLNMALKEREFAIQSMTEKVSSLSRYINSDPSKAGAMDINQILADSESMFSKAQDLYRERDETLLALNQSRQENQSLRNEMQRMKSSEIHMKNELERLRTHLLQIEENYTHEALKAEEREKVLRDEIMEVKRRAEISNTAVVDTSQRASTQIASLQEQLSMIANQRDRALAQVSSLEDEVQHHSAAVSKLQLVLEQMQRSHERKIKDTEKKWQIMLENQKKITKQFDEKLQAKQIQLEESSHALEAATRLSEQLDAKEEIIANLKSELSKVESKVKLTTQEIDSMKSNTEGKVDRVVMKSLVLGYFSTPPSQKSEVIRLLARVLDFNQEEMERAGIVMVRKTRNEQKGLLSSIFSRLPAISSSDQRQEQPQKSFTTLFVQFLENESQPIVPMPFPAEQMAQELTFKFHPNKKPQSEKTSTPRKSPLLLDIDSAFPTFTPVPAIEYSQSPSLLREVLE